MANITQSSRKNLFGKITVNKTSVPTNLSFGTDQTYNVVAVPTASGETDVKFEKQGKANVGHVLLIVLVAGAGIYLLNKKIGDYI